MIACQISEYTHIEWNPVYPLLRQSMRGNFHHRLSRAMAIRFRKHAIQFKGLGRGVRGGQDFSRHVIFNSSYQGILAAAGCENRFHQKRGCALSIRSCDAGYGKSFRRSLVKVGAQSS